MKPSEKIRPAVSGSSFYVLAVDLDMGPESVAIIKCSRRPKAGELLQSQDVLEVDGFVPERRHWLKRLEVQTSVFSQESGELIGLIDYLDCFSGGGQTWASSFGEAKSALVSAVFLAGIKFGQQKSSPVETA